MPLRIEPPREIEQVGESPALPRLNEALHRRLADVAHRTQPEADSAVLERELPRRRLTLGGRISSLSRSHSSISVTIRALSYISLVSVAAMNSAGWLALRCAHW